MESSESWPAIVGLGTYLPEDVVTNQELVERLGLRTSPEAVVKLTGIEVRRFAADDEPSSALATRAAQMAIDNSGVQSESFRGVFVSTSTTDDSISLASRIHGSTGLPEECLTHDVRAACSGNMAILEEAVNRTILGEPSDANLIIGVSRYSRLLNPQDPRTAILFGDGAGAAVIQNVADGRRPQFAFLTHSDPEALRIPGGGDVLPLTGPDDPNGKVHMDGAKVKGYALDMMSRAVTTVAQKEGAYNHESDQIDWDNFDLFVPHQANLKLMQTLAERLGAPAEKIAVVVDKTGNTSSASTFLALQHARENGQLPHGKRSRALFVAIGAGFMAGAAAIDIALPNQHAR